MKCEHTWKETLVPMCVLSVLLVQRMRENYMELCKISDRNPNIYN
jgi:hypothetical protein